MRSEKEIFDEIEEKYGDQIFTFYKIVCLKLTAKNIFWS